MICSTAMMSELGFICKTSSLYTCFFVTEPRCGQYEPLSFLKDEDIQLYQNGVIASKTAVFEIELYLTSLGLKIVFVNIKQV